MKRCAKNGGAARRRFFSFFAICENPVGVVNMTPPPPGQRLSIKTYRNSATKSHQGPYEVALLTTNAEGGEGQNRSGY